MAEPVPPGLPEMLPDDVGQVDYVYVMHRFGRADELTIDDIAPINEFDPDNPYRRANIADRLRNIEGHHFLFGTPGVRAAGGRYLYHCTSVDRLELIQRNGLRLGPLASTNDPLEGRTWYRGAALLGGGVPGRRPDSNDRADADRLFQGVEALRSRTLSISFGRDHPHDPDANPIGEILASPRLGYANPAMWAHYGDGHRGVCLILDRQAFDRNATEALTGYSIGHEVTYTRDFEDYASLWFYESGDQTTPIDYLGEHVVELLLTKNPEWEYEREYRWICVPDDPTASQAFVPLDGVLVGLVIGDQSTDAQTRECSWFAHVNQIQANVAQCTWNDPHEFGATRLRTAR